MEVKTYHDSPNIGKEIEFIIGELPGIDNYVLSLQLDYRDNNTIFYLDKVEKITFAKEWMEIEQKNNSYAYFDYNHILEYCVINAEDVIDLGVI